MTSSERAWIPSSSRPFGNSGGRPSGRTGHLNPQYRLSVPSELNAEGATCVFITLTQRRPDLGDATAAALKYIALCAKRGQAGGTAWSAPNSMSAIREMGSDFVTSGALKNDLTVSMELLNLSVDEQVSLMAATFEAEDETEYVLRVYCPMCTLKLEKWHPPRQGEADGVWVEIESTGEGSETVLVAEDGGGGGGRRASTASSFQAPI